MSGELDERRVGFAVPLDLSHPVSIWSRGTMQSADQIINYFHAAKEPRRKTAAQSVEAICNSGSFQQARRQYWNSSYPITDDVRTKALRAFDFTWAQIQDQRPTSHQFVIARLRRIFDRLEDMRVKRHWAFKMPERDLVISLIRNEQRLLDAARIAENV